MFLHWSRVSSRIRDRLWTTELGGGERIPALEAQKTRGKKEGRSWLESRWGSWEIGDANR